MKSFFISERWAIGIVRAPIHAFLDSAFVPEVQWVGDCGPWEFLADCFGIMDGDNRVIMAERFTYRDYSWVNPNNGRRARIGRGHITSIAIDGEGLVISEMSAIDTGEHMSYPCTIWDRGWWYLVAEESSRNTVNLYRRHFDGNWRCVKELLPRAVIDPTVFRYAERWWMFGTTAEHPLTDLCIWYADQLEGDWQPHSGNPVRSDLRNSRPGGTPFCVDGDLYRPAQNNSLTYGGSVVINRVDALTPDSFDEHPVREILAPPGTPFQDGLHTLATFGGWTLIDAKEHVVLPRVIVKKLLERFSAR